MKIFKSLFCAALFFLLFGCRQSHSPAYIKFYSHLNQMPPHCPRMIESDYFLVLLVDARHLDYTDCHSFIKTVAKHPSDDSKSGDVGHAWIYLRGIIDGMPVYLEGGHSGECGGSQARYFDGIMNYIDYGYANPTMDQQLNVCRYEPNPIQYLWETQNDGFFQWGAGSHTPTYAIKVDLSAEKFERILFFVRSYLYSEYSLVKTQCASFVANIASLAGLDLECSTTLYIEPFLSFHGSKLRLWTDPCYSEFILSSPDILERSMMEAVREGKAECALNWYKETHRASFFCRIQKITQAIARFPKRYERYLYLQTHLTQN